MSLPGWNIPLIDDVGFVPIAPVSDRSVGYPLRTGDISPPPNKGPRYVWMVVVSYSPPNHNDRSQPSTPRLILVPMLVVRHIRVEYKRHTESSTAIVSYSSCSVLPAIT